MVKDELIDDSSTILSLTPPKRRQFLEAPSSNLILTDQITPSPIRIEVRRGNASHVRKYQSGEVGAF